MVAPAISFNDLLKTKRTNMNVDEHLLTTSEPPSQITYVDNTSGTDTFMQDLVGHMKKVKESATEVTNSGGLFKVKPASVWIEEAKIRPIPRMLFDHFWYEGELNILFADTNVGKSIVAVQIGNSVSSGSPIQGFDLEAPAQKVLYFDFELTDKQFEARYSSEFCNHYSFNPNFYRAEIDPYADFPNGHDGFERYLNDSLDIAIKETGAKVLIIDNITYLKNETEKAKDALPLMKHLKALKSKYGLSILALAHTPKRDPSKPLTRNDLQGSKMLINFCDSAFAIGESTHEQIRYFKQIKARNTEIKYGADNVCLCQINKPDNFLQFEFISYSSERKHLKEMTEKEIDNINERVLELKKAGRSLREIGSELGISHMKVSRILKETPKTQ